MIEITADMEAIIKRAILSFVATVNEDGTHNLSPKASLTVTNGVLYFADIASPRTILNLKRNPAVEINVIDIVQRRGYRFKGRALILPLGDDEYSLIADWIRATNGPEYPVDHVVKIETTSITPLLSPAHVFSDPPRSQDEIRSTFYQKYGVKPSGHRCRVREERRPTGHVGAPVRIQQRGGHPNFRSILCNLSRSKPLKTTILIFGFRCGKAISDFTKWISPSP